MYSLVIPVFRNAETIEALLIRLDALAAALDAPLEVVAVVDGSPDDSFLRLREGLRGRRFSAQLLAHSRNFGSFAAIRTGLAVASGPCFAVMAADLQEPPELAETFFRTLAADQADVVLGTRRSRADPPLVQATSALFWRLYRRFVQPEMPAGGVDMFACNARVREALLGLRESNSTLVGLLMWVGFRRALVPYDRQPRPAGRSGWTFRRRLRYLEDSFYAFSDLPMRLLTWGGLLGICVTVLLSAVIVIARLAGAITVEGYAATVLIVMFFGALNLFCLGLIGGYVWRGFENSKARPHALTLSHERFVPGGDPAP